MSTPASHKADRAGVPPQAARGPVRRVAVVGGGISGLSTAYALQQQAAGSGVALDVTLLERADRWGGKIKTEHVEGFGSKRFVVEAGPDSFITQKPGGLRLARALGLTDRLLDTNDDRRKTFVVNRGRPTPLPDGVLMIVPTRFMPFALSPLISIPGKIRMGFDLFIPAKRDGEDETLAEFIRRRLGDEALDKIAEPLMSGIYNAEAEMQSLLATFPRFRRIEEQHGSLIRGMLASLARRPASPPGNGQKKPAMFVSLLDGTEELVTTLVDALDADMRLNTGVERVTRGPGGYTLALTDGTTLSADALVLAVPAFVAADLLGEVAPDAADTLSSIRYVSTGTISLAYRRSEIDHPLDGFGIVIPRSERRPINAITWSSTKFDHRAPDGYVLMRVFFGGSRSPEMMEKPDDDILRIARSEVAALMGITAPPVLHRIYRWFDSNPQYDVGHLDRVDAIEAALPAGVFVTGSPYRGVGLPDCIQQGEDTAEKVLDLITANAVADQHVGEDA